MNLNLIQLILKIKIENQPKSIGFQKIKQKNPFLLSFDWILVFFSKINFQFSFRLDLSTPSVNL